MLRRTTHKFTSNFNSGLNFGVVNETEKCLLKNIALYSFFPTTAISIYWATIVKRPLELKDYTHYGICLSFSSLWIYSFPGYGKIGFIAGGAIATCVKLFSHYHDSFELGKKK